MLSCEKKKILQSRHDALNLFIFVKLGQPGSYECENKFARQKQASWVYWPSPDHMNSLLDNSELKESIKSIQNEAHLCHHEDA